MMIVCIGPQQEVNVKKLFSSVIFLLLLFPFCCTAQSTVKSRLEYLGSYSNLTSSNSEDPHMDGYRLNLFREDNLIFGSFSFATGIEVPTAPIEALKLDLANHYIFFRVRMSLGREAWPKDKETGEGRLTRDLIEFNGKITKDAVSGTLLLKDGYNPDLPGHSEFVILKRKDRKGLLSVTSSYAQWAEESWNRPLSDDWEQQ